MSGSASRATRNERGGSMKSLGRTLLLTVATASTVGAAGDPSPPQAPPAAPAPAATPMPAPSPTPAADIQDFVPTEKVSADDAVAFPVDI